MAQQLRLKSQRVSAKLEFAFAVDVLVDTGVTHLADPFTYAVSKEDSDLQIGSLVTVPFSNKTLRGLIISKNPSNGAGLKFLKKVIHKNPIVNSEQIDLIEKSVERWTGSFWQYLKYVIPNLPAKLHVPSIENAGISRKIVQPELRIGSNYHDLIDLISNRVNPSRQILIVVPEIKFLNFIRNELKLNFTEYGSHLSGTERELNYLKVLSGEANLILSTRSGIFLPLKRDAEILVVDDLSFAFYESRFPFWNVRDVALLRSKYHSITFYNHSPSLELVRLTESKWMRMKEKKLERPKVHFSDGRITYQATIKNGLRTGPVLVLVPERGYVNTLVCGKCRNVSTCESCGGRLIKKNENSFPSCSLCFSIVRDLRCNYCQGETFLSFRKGIERTLEELGKQFPGVQIRKSTDSFETYKKNQIILSTYQDFPIARFSAVVALGAERFSYQNQLRSTEIARKFIYDIRALQATEYFLNLPSNDYFANLMVMGSPYKSALKEYEEREVVKLPPNYRIVVIECDSKAVSILESQPFVFSVHYGNGRALVKSKIEDGAALTSFIQGISKYRSMRKLKPWNVKVDPLDV